jgi:hypothetical protein
MLVVLKRCRRTDQDRSMEGCSWREVTGRREKEEI